MAIQFFVIFGCLALGEVIVGQQESKLPSSIIGMLILTLLLKLGWVKLGWVERLSQLFNIQSRFLLCTAWGGFNTLSQRYQGLLAFDNDGNSCQYGLSIGCHWTHAPTRH